MTQKYAFESHLTRLGRWALAISFGVVLHASAAGLVFLQASDSEEVTDSGPIMFDLALMAVAPPVEELEAPPGPRADAAPEVMESQQQLKPAEADDTPLLQKTAHEPDDPDLKMPEAKPEKPDEEEKKEEPEEVVEERPDAAASAPSPETTAPPPVKAEPAAQAAAPEAGLSDNDQKAIARWQKKVVVHLHSHKRYPNEARKRRIQGEVVVKFTIDRSGRVIARSVTNGSGAKILDNAAVGILERASPLPVPPPQLSGNEFELTLPIRYQVM